MRKNLISALLITFFLLWNMVWLNSLNAMQIRMSNEFVEISCFPEADYFSIQIRTLRGKKANLSRFDPSLRDDLYKKYKIIANAHAWETEPEKRSGSCVIQGKTLSWAYEDIGEYKKGWCGLTYKGGYLSLTLEDLSLLNHIRIGGYAFCRSSLLQSVSFYGMPASSQNGADDPGPRYELSLEGYWGDHAKGAVSQIVFLDLNAENPFPYSTEKLEEEYPVCVPYFNDTEPDPGSAQELPEACQEQRYLVKNFRLP